MLRVHIQSPVQPVQITKTYKQMNLPVLNREHRALPFPLEARDYPFARIPFNLFMSAERLDSGGIGIRDFPQRKPVLLGCLLVQPGNYIAENFDFGLRLVRVLFGGLVLADQKRQQKVGGKQRGQNDTGRQKNNQVSCRKRRLVIKH
ncbi:hypothetical protein D3C71_1445230 [compost metagenome]